MACSSKVSILVRQFALTAFSQCNVALSDTTYGVVILPTVLYLTRVLAKFAVTLDKNPEVVAQQRKEQAQAQGDSSKEKIGFVESSANVVRDAFIKCLADKSGMSGPGRSGKPENKRIGIYQTANFCLKLLFQCRKLRNAEQMFVSIDNQSPPLSYYPASQRVTYLYYLGRYHFANNHFFRAQVALQEAYNTCHRDALKHKRLILIYLIASNIILGRFPSASLFSLPEASSIRQYFQPLCRLIAQGDIVGFNQLLDIDSASATWFLHYRILLPLRSRCEMLVWRSLARKVFITSGYRPEDGRTVPFVKLYQVQAAVSILARIHENNGGYAMSQPVASEFAGIEEAASESGFDLEGGYYSQDKNAISTSTNGYDVDLRLSAISVAEIESIFSSLIQQGFLNGFITHENPRFAIPGAKARGPLATGFPAIWQTIVPRADDEVPGWVKGQKQSAAIGFGGGIGGMGGRVVSLSGARPVGAGT